LKRRRLGRGLGDLAVFPLQAGGAASSAAGRRDLRPADPASFAARHTAPLTDPAPTIVCVTSGKGGTGKSVVTSNLAVHLAATGVRVMAVDADMGLANLHLLFGLSPSRTIYSVIEGGAPLEEIAEFGPVGVRVAAGASGRPDMADLHPSRLRRLLAAIEGLSDRTRVVLIDTGAGIGRATTSFLYAVNQIIVVTTPDLTAMTDAYAVIKNVAHNNAAARMLVVVNRAHDAFEGLEVFTRLDKVCQKYLGRPLVYLGHVMEDARVPASVAARIPILLNQPASPAAACLRGIGRSLLLEIRLRQPTAAPGEP